MIYFISDTHFCHDKDFLYVPRGYTNIYDMNKDFIQKWNSVVNIDDEVYHLGDVMLNDNDAGMDILQSLKGNIHIILGNHDTDERVLLYPQAWNVVDVCYADSIKAGKWTLFLSHYPAMVSSTATPKKRYNISGHTHSKEIFQFPEYHIYNVAVDAHDGYPVPIEKILSDINNRGK